MADLNFVRVGEVIGLGNLIVLVGVTVEEFAHFAEIVARLNDLVPSWPPVLLISCLRSAYYGSTFTQEKVFRLVSDHHIQHGPSFPKPIDFQIDMKSGELTFKAEDGSISKEHMDLLPDVSNGLPPNLLLNIPPSTPEAKVSYVVPGQKPRLIHIAIRPTGTLPLRIGGFRRKATDFTLHVQLGEVTGIVAPIIRKQPSDYHIWLQAGDPPAFVREDGPRYEQGPIWRMEQISLSFRKPASVRASNF